MSTLHLPRNAHVQCDAIVDLIDRHARPYKFRVTVSGKPPHATTRVYEIISKDDNSAALAGIDRFCKEMSTEMRILISK